MPASTFTPAFTPTLASVITIMHMPTHTHTHTHRHTHMHTHTHTQSHTPASHAHPSHHELQPYMAHISYSGILYTVSAFALTWLQYAEDMM